MSNKIPLIYILSNGRSGSTILDLLLGAHENIWTLGEAQNLYWEIKKDESKCGCGKNFEQCDYWSEIIRKVEDFNLIYPIHNFREGPGRGRVLRYKLLSDFYLNRFSKDHIDNIHEYGLANYKFAELALSRASSIQKENVNYLVDASKDLYRLIWLQKSGMFDIKVIHLKKDSRAFVYSMIRRDEKKSYRKIIRMASRWRIENYLMSNLTSKYLDHQNIMSLDYEIMASNYKQTMKEIFEWLNLKTSNQSVDEFRKKKQHAISGNQARWENREIYLDEKWKKEMKSLDRSLVSFICF